MQCQTAPADKRTERGHSCPRVAGRPTDASAEAGGEGAWLRPPTDVLVGGWYRNRNRDRYRNRKFTTTRYLGSTATLNQKRETRNRKSRSYASDPDFDPDFDFDNLQPGTMNRKQETFRPADASPSCGCYGRDFGGADPRMASPDSGCFGGGMVSKSKSGSISKSKIHNDPLLGKYGNTQPETRNEEPEIEIICLRSRFRSRSRFRQPSTRNDEPETRNFPPCGCFAVLRMLRPGFWWSRPTDVCAEAGGEGAWLRRTADVLVGGWYRNRNRDRYRKFTTTRYL